MPDQHLISRIKEYGAHMDEVEKLEAIEAAQMRAELRAWGPPNTMAHTAGVVQKSGTDPRAQEFYAALRHTRGQMQLAMDLASYSPSPDRRYYDDQVASGSGYVELYTPIAVEGDENLPIWAIAIAGLLLLCAAAFIFFTITGRIDF